MSLETPNNEHLESLNTDDNKLQEISDFFESQNLDTMDFNFFYKDYDDITQKEILEYFDSMKENKDLTEFLQEEGLPMNLDSFEQIKNKFKGEENADRLENNENSQEDAEASLNGILQIKELSSGYEDFFKDSGINFDIDKDNKEEVENLVNELVDFLQKDENYLKLLELAKENGEEEFDKVATTLKGISSHPNANFAGLDKRIDEIKISFISDRENPYYGNENIINGLTIDGKSKLITDGDTVKYGDQKIDFGTKPPEKFIVGENGFEIKSNELDYKVDKKGKKESEEAQREETENNKKIAQIDQGITQFETQKNDVKNLNLQNSDIIDHLGDHYDSNTEIISIINKIRNIDIDSQFGEENSKGREILEGKLRKLVLDTIDSSITSLRGNKEKLIARNEQLNTIIFAFKQKEDERLKKYEKEVKEKDERARKVASIYNDLLANSISDIHFKEILSRITSSSPVYLKGGQIINGINIENLKISGGGIQIMDKTEFNSPLNKRYFAETMNVILTGNSDFPINLDSMNSSNTTFKNNDGEIIDRIQFTSMIKEKLGSQPISIMMSNIQSAKTQNMKS